MKRFLLPWAMLLAAMLLSAAFAPPGAAQAQGKEKAAQGKEKAAPDPDEEIPVTGVLRKLDKTRFPYASHEILKPNRGVTSLRSDVVDLDAYVGQRVTVYFFAGPPRRLDGPPVMDIIRVEPAPDAPTPEELREGPGPGPAEDICAVPPGTPLFDEVLMGVLEALEEPSSRGDTHAVEGPDGSPTTLRSDAVDLDEYAGQRVAVYVASAPGGGEPLRDVVRVGPPPGPAAGPGEEGQLAVVFCDRVAPPPGESETTGAGGGPTEATEPPTAEAETRLPDSGGGVLLALGAGALVVSGGLLARRILR